MHIFPTYSEEISDAITTLRALGFSVLPKLSPAQYVGEAAAPLSDWAHVVLIDTETTGNNSAVDLPIEIAAVKVAVSRHAIESGHVTPDDVQFISSIQMLEDPGVPSSEAAQRVHKIDPSLLVSKSFDENALQEFVSSADLMVAHKASFDRHILERRFPDLFGAPDVMKPWVCTIEDIEWRDKYEFSARTLDYLAFRAGFTYEAHRALNDCEALAAALSLLGAWDDVFAAMREQTYQVWAVGSPFDKKDEQKRRGYFWNDGADGRPKAWAREVRGRPALLEELRWLADNVYSNARNAQVIISRYSAKQRHSSLGYALARNTQTDLRLAIETLEASLQDDSDALSQQSAMPHPAAKAQTPRE